VVYRAAFANFFRDDTSDDASNCFPSMYDHTDTGPGYRRLRKLLMVVCSFLSHLPVLSSLSVSFLGHLVIYAFLNDKRESFHLGLRKSFLARYTVL
jgi:hypothetical protein